MLPDFVEEAVRQLCTARRGSPVHELPASCRPQSDADAYQIQDAVTRRLGLAIGGWKVGVYPPPPPRSAHRSMRA